jgi:hypothetical protein
MKFIDEKGTHSSKCCEPFLQGFKVLGYNTENKKAKDICIKHPTISSYMFICFMAMAQKKIITP